MRFVVVPDLLWASVVTAAVVMAQQLAREVAATIRAVVMGVAAVALSMPVLLPGTAKAVVQFCYSALLFIFHLKLGPAANDASSCIEGHG